MTGITGQAEKDRQNRTGRTGQAGQNRQDRIAQTGFDSLCLFPCVFPLCLFNIPTELYILLKTLAFPLPSGFVI